MRRLIPLLPFLVALGPIAYLWAENADIVRPASVVAPVVITLLATGVAFGLVRLVTRDTLRSALSVSVIAIPLLTFGYQLDALLELPGGLVEPVGADEGGEDGAAWVLAAVNSAVAAVLVTLLFRSGRGLDRIAGFGIVMAAAFLMLSAPRIVSEVGSARPSSASVASAATRDLPSDLPDIYYIVLDAYARGDVLTELYGHDNEPFLAGLEERGFYVARESFSNYAITPLSLASTLHMRYLEDPVETRIGSGARSVLRDLIHEPAVVGELRSFGYRYVHFNTMWWGTNAAPAADVVYSREGFLESEFGIVFLRKTLPGHFLVDLSPAWHETHLYTLRQLRSVPEIDGPTFTMAHLLLPHPPYVFDAEGNVLRHQAELTGGWREPDAYVEQMRFLNAELETLVDELIATSEQMPIIILQADHGPAGELVKGAERLEGYWERMAILNALLLPEENRGVLYPSISPVNTFRVVLSEVIGTEAPMLPDRSYFSWYPATGSPTTSELSDEIRDVTDDVRSRR